MHNIKLSHFSVLCGFKYICIVVHPKGLMGDLIEMGDGENRGRNKQFLKILFFHVFVALQMESPKR